MRICLVLSFCLLAGSALADEVNVNLYLGQGAVLLGSTDPKAFTQAVVYANGIENASITGNGTI